jgi:tRNA pseudouridine55 synthase
MARRNRGRDVHGIVLLDKPLGLSSNQALQAVKDIYNARKAGHTGALDPEASGLLPICLGEATKFSQLLLESDKGYETTAHLGIVRSTGDREGDIVSTRPVPELDSVRIEEILERFRGEVEQVPPMFSALKFNGKPLYELARKGITAEEAAVIAERKRRIISILALQQLDFRNGCELDLNVVCSKGTYIRTLVEDIGEAIGCGAYVSRLHRVLTGPYRAAQMVSLEKLQSLCDARDYHALDQYLMPMESSISNLPLIPLTVPEAQKVMMGQALETSLNDTPSVQLWAADSGVEQFMGVGSINNGRLRPTRLLNTDLLDLVNSAGD